GLALPFLVMMVLENRRAGQRTEQRNENLLRVILIERHRRTLSQESTLSPASTRAAPARPEQKAKILFQYANQRIIMRVTHEDFRHADFRGAASEDDEPKRTRGAVEERGRAADLSPIPERH